MSYRFTNTEKWGDSWFSNLKQIEMLLFIYLCDNCDIAGFIEVNYKRWANDLSSSIDTIEGACKGLSRGIVVSKEGDCFYIKNFLKHQKNLPLNETNKAHVGILRRFDIYSKKFDIQDVNQFIEGASKGLLSPTGNGNGNGIGIFDEEKDLKIPTWRDSYDLYISECKNAFSMLMKDDSYIKQQSRLNPNVDIKLTLEKAYINFWGTEEGWLNKKKSKSETINWKSTATKAIGINKVYFQRNPIQTTIPEIDRQKEIEKFKRDLA